MKVKLTEAACFCTETRWSLLTYSAPLAGTSAETFKLDEKLNWPRLNQREPTLNEWDLKHIKFCFNNLQRTVSWLAYDSHILHLELSTYWTALQSTSSLTQAVHINWRWIHAVHFLCRVVFVVFIDEINMHWMLLFPCFLLCVFFFFFS